MTRFRFFLALAIGSFVFADSRSAVAQLPAAQQGVVGGTGMATIKRQPDLMRMRLDVTAKGKTLADALAKLKARREAALKACSETGANAATLVATPPRIAPEDQNRQQIVNSLRQRSRGTARPGKKAEPEPVNVASTITAEWLLQGSGPEELLLASQALEDKIKATIAKSMPKEELSPEEEELEEEVAQQMANYGNRYPKQGEPAFLFIAKVSKEDYTKAAAKAFAMAKVHAQRLADAAGVPLGELRGVEGNDREQMTMMNYGQRLLYNSEMQDEGGTSGLAENADGEATGPSPSEVRLIVAVGATFALGK